MISIKAITKFDDKFYIAMEFCNGGDLLNYLVAKGGYLKEEEARFVLRQILSGTRALNEQQQNSPRSEARKYNDSLPKFNVKCSIR